MKDLKEFLRESNAIEGVYNTHSLTLAKKAWGYLISQKEISPKVVKKTHETLMQGYLPREATGHYRTAPVYIGGRETPKHQTIAGSIEKWCERANLMVEHPGTGGRIAQDIQNHHVAYEKIHPFFDGNGRTGRLFLNWQRVMIKLPILVIKEEEKHDYYQWFLEK